MGDGFAEEEEEEEDCVVEEVAEAVGVDEELVELIKMSVLDVSLDCPSSGVALPCARASVIFPCGQRPSYSSTNCRCNDKTADTT